MGEDLLKFLTERQDLKHFTKQMEDKSLEVFQVEGKNVIGFSPWHMRS